MNAGLIILRVASERRDAQNEHDGAGLRSSVTAATPSQQQLRRSSTTSLQPSTQLVVSSSRPSSKCCWYNLEDGHRAAAAPRGETRAAAAAQHLIRSRSIRCQVCRSSSSRRRQCPSTMSGRRGLFFLKVPPHAATSRHLTDNLLLVTVPTVYVHISR